MLAERMRPQAGDLISGKYRLVRLIGDGGMGSVFEARHEYLGSAVALKFLHPELARRQGLVARFLQEARLSASMKSHHIAHVTDVDQTSDGAAYLVMELLEGDSLQSILEREKKLSLDVALDYTMQILSGLQAAHAIGVVHRDLKPDNVFVVKTPQGPLVKLLDFGIAKLRNSKEFQVALTRPGVMMGTPEYMAPEQAYSAESVDVRADLYSVGTMLYEMVAGARAVQGDDAQQIAAVVMARKVTRLDEREPSIPKGLADVVHRAMAPVPTERFASAEDLRNALVPFCGRLSLAGRLAATPAPSGVPPTLPPEAEPAPRGTPATQTGGGQPATPPRNTQAGMEFGPTPAAPAYGYPPPAVHYSGIAPTPTRTRGPRRLSVWLLVAMVGLAIGIVAVAFAMAQTTEDRQPERTSAITNAPVSTTPTTATSLPTPARTAQVAITPPVQPTTTAAPNPTATNRPSKPRLPDGGVEDASPVAVPSLPTLPFPLPSALPMPLPIPSMLPPFELPGLPPPAPVGSH